MYKYILKRLLWLVLVVVGVAIVIFTILYFTPGDPARIILGSIATPEQLAEERARLGIDQPYFIQLFNFLKQTFLHFDLGTSFIYNNSVSTELFKRIPITLEIALLSMILYIAIGLPLGIISALKQNTIVDRLCMLGSLIFVSIPGFWLAMMMVLLFSVKLNWLPPFGADGFKCLIMPCVANAMASLAMQARQTRSAMLEVINSDYVVTARAKGLTEREILFKYILPNAMIPLITFIGSGLAVCLGGAVVIEKVFAIPGTGMYMTSAISNRDYPIVRGSVVFLSIIFSLVMLIVDIIYAYVDPRIKAQYENQSVKRKGRKK